MTPGGGPKWAHTRAVMERTTIDVGGAGAEHLRAEREGPALVLLHGAGGNAEVWRPVCAELRGLDLAAPSLPGRGGSAGPAPRTAAEAADWVEKYLDAVRAHAPILVGHSYGGAVALELALRGRAQGLVLVATGARLRVHPAVIAGAEAAAAGGPRLSSRVAFGHGTPEDVVAAYEDAATRTPPEAALADWRACDAFDRMEGLAAIEAPALVISGADDALTPPKYHDYLADRLPRAQRESIEGAGHMLPWERPRVFARMARTWAAGVT